MKKIILIFSILFNCGFLFSQNLLHHVEPISWWVNMKSSKFQILIHGDQLKELDIKIPDSKIELLKVLWELVTADSVIDAYEENLYFQIAELIKIKRSTANQIKQQAT